MMHTPPKDCKRRNPLRLIVLMGLIVLMFLFAAGQIGQVAQHFIAA